MIAFYDTNVLLDVLSEREPFFADSAACFSLAEHRRVDGYVSAISFNNIHYLVRRLAGKAVADQSLRTIRACFSIVDLDAQILDQAIDSHMSDFEDSIQYFSASRIAARVLITRNVKDFPRGGMLVQTPSEFSPRTFPRELSINPPCGRCGRSAA